MTEVSIIDAAEREQALDISQSFCIQAPAGSGKTELLTQRLLKLLIHCEEPEEILAFTFTRKAAFEMRQRLLKSLRQENSESLTPLSRELAAQVLVQNEVRKWHLLENPQRLQIKTIDSFNASICAQLPVVSGLGGQVNLVEDMEPIYQQIIELTLAKLENNSPLGQEISVFLTHLDNNLGRAQQLLIPLLHKRDQWLSNILRARQENLRKELSNNLQAIIIEVLGDACSILQPFGERLMSLVKYAAENLEKNNDDSLSKHNFQSRLPAAEVKFVDAWQAIANFLLTKTEGNFRKSVTKTNGFPKEADGSNTEEKALFKNQKSEFIHLLDECRNKPDLLPALQNLLVLPAPEYRNEDWTFLNALSSVLLDLVVELNVYLNKSNQADYIHISASALQALNYEESLSDLALRLDYRIKHILVDEFQDTSHHQIELLKSLSSGWQAADGRTLFIVGDGMQSCYGFRNADVGLFLKARDEGIGAVKLQSRQLKMNFRSSDSLVEWVNHIFSQSFPQQDSISRGAVAYSPSRALKVAEAPGVVTSLLVHPADAKADLKSSRKKEAELVLEQLNKLPLTTDCSIAILVRTRGHLEAIIPLLRQAAIPWNASGIDPLSSFSVIRDLLSLLRALTNLADKTALFALLRTPFIGLPLNDIHLVATHAEKQEQSLWQSLCGHSEQTDLSRDTQQRLARVMPILLRARKQRQTLPLRDWLEQCWLELGGPACLQNDHELVYVERFLQLLEAEIKGADISNIHAFERKCEATYLGSTHDASAKLQIMTIHNAKGLEFDYVLIPGLDRRPRSNDKELFLWQEKSSAKSDSRLLMAPLNAKGQEDNPTYVYLKNEANIRNKLENTRLLYIAITRARKQAFLFAQIQADKTGSYKAPPEPSLLATIWTALVKDIDAQRLIELSSIYIPSRDNETETLTTLRLKNSWSPTAIQQKGFIPRESVIPSDQHLNLIEKKVGDIIHDCLRLKVEQNLDVLAENTKDKYEAYWFSLLKPVCPDQQSMQQALQVIKDNLRRCLQHDRADWLFDNSHQDSHCELAISDYRQQWRKEHIIDRTFIADGIRWIVDYKSSALTGNQTQADFIRSQEELYSAQLHRYAELFRAMEKLPVKTALFFTALPYWHEIPL
tara:strand:- start:228856 stop:232242 length:3387 start_codon:yes stop_codon:yes gene_type:complete